MLTRTRACTTTGRLLSTRAPGASRVPTLLCGAVAGGLMAAVVLQSLPSPPPIKSAEAAPERKTNTLPVGTLPGKEDTLLSEAPITGKAVLPEEVDMVLFHGGCPDGFGAAFAAFLARGKACQYVGIAHGNHKRLPTNVDGKVVAILDFSFDAATMAELLQRAKGVIVLDHHASAETNLASMPAANKVFAMRQSGASLAWDFFGSGACPILLRYIEDRDIWRWAMKSSQEFSAAASMELPVPPPGVLAHPDEAFAPWVSAYEGGEAAVAAIAEKGRVILAYQGEIVERACRGARVRVLKEAPNEKAYVVNSTVLASDIGNALAKKGIEEGVSYAAVATYKPGKKSGEGMWALSLRSLHGTAEGAADVSVIAGKYGGGGHRAASGMGAQVRDLEELFVPE